MLFYSVLCVPSNEDLCEHEGKPRSCSSPALETASQVSNHQLPFHESTVGSLRLFRSVFQGSFDGSCTDLEFVNFGRRSCAMATYGKKRHILPVLSAPRDFGAGADSKRHRPIIQGTWSYLVNNTVRAGRFAKLNESIELIGAEEPALNRFSAIQYVWNPQHGDELVPCS
jgi:hypothetical protein